MLLIKEIEELTMRKEVWEAVVRSKISNTHFKGEEKMVRHAGF